MKVIDRIFILLLFLLASIIQTSFAISLEKCLQIAFENNASIIAAKENVNIASAKMGQAASSVLPTVNFQGMKGKNYSQPMKITLPSIFGGGTISTAPDEVSDYTSYSFNLQQNLFTGGKILTSLTIAKSGYEMALLELKKASQEVEFNVTKSYYECLKLSKNLEIIDSTIENLSRNLKITETLYNAGISTQTDILRIKAMIANYKVARINMKNAFDIALLSLESVIGKKLPMDTKLEDNITISDFEFNIKKEEVVNIALSNRPDYLSYKQALKIAESAVNMAYSNYLPNIAFTYSTGNSKNLYNKNFSSNTDLNNWRAMFVASWILFDGFKTQNQIKEAFSSLNMAKAQEKMIVDGLILDVSSSYVSLLSAFEKIKATKVASDLSYRALKSVEVSYSSDISSRQSLLEAQTAYHSAMTDYWNSIYDLEIAKAKLNKAVGKKII